MKIFQKKILWECDMQFITLLAQFQFAICRDPPESWSTWGPIIGPIFRPYSSSKNYVWVTSVLQTEISIIFHNFLECTLKNSELAKKLALKWTKTLRGGPQLSSFTLMIISITSFWPPPPSPYDIIIIFSQEWNGYRKHR